MRKPECPNIIDVEASGFGTASYPIEVGLALQNGERYCSLIQPDDSWVHWDETAQELHGIKRAQLFKHGKPIEKVCEDLNELLAGETIYSDAWVVDKPWMDTLFHAARVPMLFEISPIESIQTECQYESWDAVRQAMIAELGLQRHRASADAFLIQVIYMRTRERCDIIIDDRDVLKSA